MDRRSFLRAAIGAVPATLLAEEAAMTQQSKSPVFVPAGADRSNQRFRLGERSTIDSKVAPTDTNGNLFIIENRQTRGFGPPRHVHPEQDEWFFAIEGEFRVEVGEEKFLLKPGDSLLAPRGIPHVWAQVSSDTGRLLVGFQPAGQMEAFFHEIARRGGIPPPKEAAEIFAAHGMRVVGPPLTLE